MSQVAYFFPSRPLDVDKVKLAELKEKINKDLNIECPIATFHSVGNAIIKKNEPDEKLNIVDGSKLYFVIRDYFRESIPFQVSAGLDTVGVRLPENKIARKQCNNKSKNIRVIL